jgi:tetratricopeptide (TPR) repeat protein
MSEFEPEDSPAALRRAADLQAAGDAAGAAAIYQRLSQDHPGEAGIWAMLGDALRESGDPAAGAKALAKSSALKPDDHDIAVEWALSLLEMGNAAAALDALAGRVIPLQQSERGQAVLADAYRATGDLGKAVAHYRHVLVLAHDNKNARVSLGVCLQESGDLDGAIGMYESALAQDRDAIDALTNLGLAQSAKGWHDAALEPLRRAISLAPDDPSTHCNLGAVFQKIGQSDAALQCFETATAVGPDDAKAWSNLGNAFQDRLRLDAARSAHERAVALAPDDADIHWNQAMTLLLSGDFTAGFAAYEWRLQTVKHAPPKHGSPRWDGRDPDGLRLLLIAEQGFGDAIQLIRYAPLLHRRGAKITIRCHPKLAALFATLEGTPAIVETGSATPPVDAHVPLMSLPHLFQTTLETLPAQIPYLRATRDALSPSQRAGQRRVGLCWKGNPNHPEDAHRSCPIEVFDPLLAIGGMAWHSLQFGPDAADAVGRIESDSNRTADGNSFAETAAVLESLDLIITVDTATAHLAGALGRPVWLLLKYAPDWRWMTGRDDSPWYPSMRLFRQQAPGDWNGVIARVKTALESWKDN